MSWRSTAQAGPANSEMQTPELSLHGSTTTRERLYDLFDKPERSWKGMCVLVTSYTIIIASVVALCLSTLPSLHDLRAWDNAEKFFVAYFTLEFLVRLYSEPKRLAFMFQFLTVVDLLSILPFWVELVLTLSGALGDSCDDEENCNDFGAAGLTLRLLRLLRVLRIVRVGRYSRGLKIVGQSLVASLPVLWTMIVLIAINIVLVSFVLFLLERGTWNDDTEQWEVLDDDGLPTPSGFQSIPDAVWFSIVTFTTVGYGDVVPTTAAGRFVTSLLMVIGILGIALSTSAVGAAYIKEVRLDRLKRSMTSPLTSRNARPQLTSPPSQVPDVWLLRKDFSEMQTLQDEVTDLILRYDPILTVFVDRSVSGRDAAIPAEQSK